MKLCISLGGSDLGRSGIGYYVRTLLPRLRRMVEEDGGQLVALGTRREHAAYADVLQGVASHIVPARYGNAGPNAAYHLLQAGHAARKTGADVFLLPAANRRISLTSPLPTVAIVHDLAQLHVKGKYDKLRMLYVNQVVTRALRSATVLVSVSGATQKDVGAVLGNPDQAGRVVYNGVDTERFSPAVPNDERIALARAETGLERPFVLYVSRLEHPGKNHIRLLQAFARSKARDTHDLALAGADWGAQSMIEEEAQRLGIADSLKLLGFVSDEALPGLVAGAAAMTMVGLREGFGLPALEALAAATPVVVANAGALPEVVGDLAPLCDPLDVESIQRALDVAIFDEAHRERVRNEGPAHAAQRGWDKTATGIFDACRDALRLGRRRGVA